MTLHQEDTFASIGQMAKGESHAASLFPPALFSFSVLMFLGSIIAAAKNMMFAKILSVSAFGQLALFMIIVSYGANLLHVGLLNGLNREFMVTIGQGDEERAYRLRNQVFTSILVLLIVLIAPYLLVVSWWSGMNFQMTMIMLAAYVTIATALLFNLISIELRGRQLLFPFALMYFIQSLIIFGAGLLASLYFGLQGAIAAIIAGNTLSIVIAWVFWINPYNLIKINYNEIKYLVTIGTPLLLSCFCISLILSMDRIFVVHNYGIYELGQYQFAAMLLIGGQILAGMLQKWVNPQILIRHGQGVSARNNFHSILKIMAIIFVFFLVTCYPVTLLAGYLVKRFFPAYLGAVPFLGIFYLAAGFIVLNELPGVILNALNQQRLILAKSLAITLALFLGYFWATSQNASLLTYANIFLGGQVAMVGLELSLVSWCLSRRIAQA